MRVFDAFAVLAVNGGEPGADRAMAMMNNGAACISAVNRAEVISKLIDCGSTAAIAVETFSHLLREVMPLSVATAQAAGLLRQTTWALGLSLGDRCCLAPAKELDADVAPADRPRKQLKGFRVKLIR